MCISIFQVKAIVSFNHTLITQQPQQNFYYRTEWYEVFTDNIVLNQVDLIDPYHKEQK